jgi:hypothetical protein
METETAMEAIYRALTTSLRSTALTPSPSPACGRGEHNAQHQLFANNYLCKVYAA